MSLDYTKIPLPEEWEQQYDVPSNRFYFVDHVKKVTTWIDPRIEIYRKYKQECELKNRNMGTTNTQGQAPTTASAISSHDKKAKELHGKYPKVALSRIKQLLDENFDNVSSVESILMREVQLAHDQEVKRKSEEALKKAEAEKQLKEEQEAKLKKEEAKNSKTVQENSKRPSDKKNKLKSGESNNCQGVQKDVSLNDNQTGEIRKTGTAENDFKEQTKMKLSKENITEESKTRLDRGPDKSVCSGPNPKNKVGPNNDLIIGKESLAKGPDASNYVGCRGNVGIKAK